MNILRLSGLQIVLCSTSGVAYADALSERLHELEQSISARCLTNSFICDPLERLLKDEHSQLVLELRLKAYEAASTSSRLAPESLMAICEGFRAEGIAREARCASEWGEWIMKQGNEHPFDVISRELGQTEAERIRDRQDELGWEYWPESMLSREADRSSGGVASDTIIVPVDMDGHYRVFPEMDGVEVEMLVDTGASTVFLTGADAERIGVDISELRYDVSVLTAAGETQMAEAVVRNLTIFGLHLRNQTVLVASPADGATVSLLGMSVLKEFSEISLKGSELHIVP